MDPLQDIKQGSDAWLRSKIGKVGASKINDVMSSLKNGAEPASRRNYRMELVVARLTGGYPESYCSPAMQRGIDLEPSARTAYEFITGNDVVEVGFIEHPEILMSGASPDGLVNDDGLIEIKCPNTANHVDWLLAGVVPSEHVNQIQWQMECTGRQWCDFVSYDPRMPVELQLFVVRAKRDDLLIARQKAAVKIFLAEVSDMVDKLRKKMEAQ